MDAYKRLVAVCRLGGEDLNGWLVRQGWAPSYVPEVLQKTNTAAIQTAIRD